MTEGQRRPLTQEVLDSLFGGRCPGCDKELCEQESRAAVLVPRCHPGEGVDVFYYMGGKLQITCRVCKSLVVEIQVAQNQEEDQDLHTLMQMM